ncbi:hypothetical protein RFI_24066, partial [Reticulomyxa filosa]
IWNQNLYLIAPLLTSPQRVRYKKIKEIIESGEYDIICFQEAFVKYYMNDIKQCATDYYFHQFPHGNSIAAQSTGIVVFSKYPIIEVSVYHYFHHGDYHAYKGVGLIRIEINKRFRADIYNTHLHACYHEDAFDPSVDMYYSHRVAQAYDLASFIQLTRKSELCVLCADLNAPVTDLVAQIPKTLCRLRDVLHDEDTTYWNHTNTFTTNADNAKLQPLRLDYVLFDYNARAIANVDVRAKVLKEYAHTHVVNGYDNNNNDNDNR